MLAPYVRQSAIIPILYFLDYLNLKKFDNKTTISVTIMMSILVSRKVQAHITIALANYSRDFFDFFFYINVIITDLHSSLSSSVYGSVGFTEMSCHVNFYDDLLIVLNDRKMEIIIQKSDIDKSL